MSPNLYTISTIHIYDYLGSYFQNIVVLFMIEFSVSDCGASVLNPP